MSAIYQIKVSLAGIEPPIWRRLLVSSATTLSRLDRTLRIAMGWSRSSPYQFHAMDRHGNLVIWGNMEARLDEVLRDVGQRIGYMHDSQGRDWPHTIELESVQEANPLLQVPACLGGARACPPEQCLGFWHYPAVLQALAESSEAARPYDGFEPELFSLSQTNQRLQRRYVHYLRKFPEQETDTENPGPVVGRQSRKDSPVLLRAGS